MRVYRYGWYLGRRFVCRNYLVCYRGRIRHLRIPTSLRKRHTRSAP